jgi:regulator of protease activity HflC (stomatin/prohibitin superfamily)
VNARLIRNPIALAIAAVLLLILLASTLAVVPETKQAVIVRFGEIDRTINPYRRGVPFGQTGAGIIARIPFVEEIHWIDKRILRSTWTISRCCRPISCGSRWMLSPATGSSIRSACTSRPAPSSG